MRFKIWSNHIALIFQQPKLGKLPSTGRLAGNSNHSIPYFR